MNSTASGRSVQPRRHPGRTEAPAGNRQNPDETRCGGNQPLLILRHSESTNDRPTTIRKQAAWKFVGPDHLAYGNVPERVAAGADYSIGPDVQRVLKLVERVVRGGRQKS